MLEWRHHSERSNHQLYFAKYTISQGGDSQNKVRNKTVPSVSYTAIIILSNSSDNGYIKVLIKIRHVFMNYSQWKP